jgi:ornithine cyclodeaminase
MPVLILGERDVEELLPMRACIDVMHRAFSALDSAGYVQPVRLIAWQPQRNGAVAAMPAWMAQPQVLGAKLISVFPQNRERGLESHQGLVALYDSNDGRLLALLHAGAITAIRTAAVSGLATRLLANLNASTLAILGSGVQARTHLQAMLAVRPLETVRVWSRTFEHARALAAEGSNAGIPVHAVQTAQAAVADADLVCTVSASREPIVHGDWLAAGAHVNAAGASVPGFRELDTDAIATARVFVDSRESALAEADDLRIPLAQERITQAHIAGTLSELASGALAGRTATAEVTIFKSCGMAIEDLAAAHYVYERACEERRGTLVEF